MALKDVFLLILITTIWGVNFAISKLGMEQLPPLLLSAVRFSLVALAVFVIPRPKVDWRVIIGIGTFIGIVKFSLLFIAIHIGLGAGLASVIVQGQVFFTIILSFLFFKEAVKMHQIIGLLIGFSGLVVIGFDNGRDFNFIGFILVVLAAISWSLANMFFRQTGQVNPVAVIVWASLIAAPPIWGLSFYAEGYGLIVQSLMNINMAGIAVVLYIAILSTFFCYAVWGKMLTKYPAAHVTPFALLIPVSGLLGGLFIIGEEISVIAQIGIFIIMLGLCISVFGGLRGVKNTNA